MSGNTIRWQRGEFIKFFAKMKIRVGGQNSVDIMEGDEFDYDGSILKYSGMEIAQTGIRGAIENGWATVREESDRPVTSPVRGSRNVASSQSVNRDLSRVQRSSSMETSSYDEDEVLRIGDRSASTKGADPKILKHGDNRKVRGMEVNGDVADGQEGVTIGRVRTAARTVFSDATPGAASSKKLAEIENMSNVRASLYGKNGTISKEGVTIKTNVTGVKRADMSQEDEGTFVGNIRKTPPVGGSGVTVTDTSNIRSERAKRDAEAARPQPKAQAKSQPKVAAKPQPKATTKPQPKATTKDSGPVSPKVRVARRIDPSFPADWSFEGKLADRLSALKGVKRSPDFIEALYAAEGDQMRKVLEREYPQHFS